MRMTIFLGAIALCLSSCLGSARRPGWAGTAGSAGAGSIDGVGFAAYQADNPDSIKKARDSAYNDAMQKLVLKLRTVVKGEVKSDLLSRSEGGHEVAEETVENMTSSVSRAVLGRKRFEEYRDDSQREYWVRCSMTQEEAEAGIKEALAAAERERAMKTVSIVFSGKDPGSLALAESEFKNRFNAKGFTVSDAASRIAVSGELSVEDLGPARPMGVDLGRSCRAAINPQAVISGKTLAAKSAPGATGIGRTSAEACEKAVSNAAGQAAEELISVVLSALEP